jgi:hypothetical protein
MRFDLALTHRLSMTRLWIPLVMITVSSCQSERKAPPVAAPPPTPTQSALITDTAPRDSGELSGPDTVPWDSGELTGYYSLEDPVPTWAADIDQLSLRTHDLQFPPGDSTDSAIRALVADTTAFATGKIKLRKTSLWGDISLNDTTAGRPTIFQLRDVVLRGRRLTFTTNVVGRVSYEFSGDFVQRPEDASGNGGTVLTGRLRKLIAGRVEEADVKFSFWFGD